MSVALDFDDKHASEDLPCTRLFDYFDPDEQKEPNMEFRLIYEGPLRAEDTSLGLTGRAKDKHELRKHFHLQLRELWAQHPDLRRQGETRFAIHTTPPNLVSHPGPNVREIVAISSGNPYPGAKTWIEHIADDHQRCGGRFVPLISKAGGFTCSLNILFLRRDNPGGLITHGGDIDNRIKVLFDGLRMPNKITELGGLPITPDEDPFFCLLEDDDLITKVSVTTDRLVTPIASKNQIHDVCLVIHVTVVNPSAIFAGDRLV